MAIELYMHPLASFCWKALIALYENETAFSPTVVDLGEPKSRAAFLAVWPIGKFPVLRDGARVIPESSMIIEYLALHHPGPVQLVPADPDVALQVRLRDRFYDLHVHEAMQKIVGDRIRPADKRDAYGVEQARASLATAYAVIEREMAGKTWAIGDAFTMADCAAAPALYYANKVQPFGADHAGIASYLARLQARPSFARVLREAAPYFAMFPQG
jgi:glutathione S-transferase